MPWTGTHEQGGKLQRCAICGAHVHMRDTLRHDRENHRTQPTSGGKTQSR
jgi:hypothetical protein